VLLAGKGHETYQILGVRRIHFDDREIAQEALKEKDADHSRK
jgi:UDP-N-acetylmuramoyl-L-alanyl-D-glutamate--2,6-diaminopimelate ligase